MLSFDDPEWTNLQGTYRISYEPRRALIQWSRGHLLAQANAAHPPDANVGGS